MPANPAAAPMMRPRLRSFNHASKTYQTVFGLLHVRYAACIIGFSYLVSLCAMLTVILIYQQSLNAHLRIGSENQPSSSTDGSVTKEQDMLVPKINLKLLTIPIGVAFLTIFYLFIGIIQQKSKMLFPFIALQIFVAFALAIFLMIIGICWLCDAREVLDRFFLLGRHRDLKPEEDRLPIAIIVAVLSCLFVLQFWTTRAVCGCFRYFTDVAKHTARVANYV